MECAVEVAMHTGWTITDTYRDLTLPRYNAIQKYWKRWPPVAVSAAILAGVAPQNKSDKDGSPTPTDIDEGGMAELLAAFGQSAPVPLPEAYKS